MTGLIYYPQTYDLPLFWL